MKLLLNPAQMNDREKIIDRIAKDQPFRKALCRESFYWFIHTYLSHYVTYAMADFQKEIVGLLQDPRQQMVAFVAFRGSGKSTIATMAYVIWSMIGNPHKKYILLISQTQQLCRQILTNVKQELENNGLLILDFGPFSEEADEWRTNSLVIPQYGTRITAISSSESIRGLRHRQFRPDLVIADDVEDLELVKNKDNREKLWNWLTSEVIPIGDENTKYVFVGNMLHEDSLMMRIKQRILSGEIKGIYREYPLIDDQDRILWPSKFPNIEAVNVLKNTVASDKAWCREYLLKIISDEDRIICQENIHYYDSLPSFEKFPPREIAIGTDLAISMSESADYTTMISAYITGYGEDLKVYILSPVINKRLGFPETVNELKHLTEMHHVQFKRRPIIYVEKIGYQDSLSQQLNVEGVFCEPVSIGNLDKRARLSISSPYIKTARILFPHRGAGELIDQIVNFGIEKHDDLVDALTLMILRISEKDRRRSPSLREGETIHPITKPIISMSELDRLFPTSGDIMSKRF